MKSQRGGSRIALVLFFVFLFLCGTVMLWGVWKSAYQPAVNFDDYMNKKSIVAWRETLKRQVPNPDNPGEMIEAVFTKIHFLASGKSFPEGEHMDMITAESPTCGKADGVMDIFKVFDADPGGLMRWSYRGYIVMGDNECPFGQTVQYPHYNPDLDPESVEQRFALLQDCWISVWGPGGIQNKVRCGQSEYYGYANMKAVSPPGNSPEVFHFIVMSDDGISAIPFSKLQEVMRQSGIEVSLNQFFEIIERINNDPENPAFVPIWQPWRWK